MMRSRGILFVDVREDHDPNALEGRTSGANCATRAGPLERSRKFPDGLSQAGASCGAFRLQERRVS